MTLEQQLIACMDSFLSTVTHRSLVEAAEVVDFCLDLRQIVARSKEVTDDSRLVAAGNLG
jgi:hypothetical protein